MIMLIAYQCSASVEACIEFEIVLVFHIVFLNHFDATGDKVAQLVWCRIGNQRVAGSIPGRLGHFGLFLGNIVYLILLQLYPAV